MQLAIETTGQTGSVAVLAGETVLQQTVLAGETRTAAALAPEIDRLLKWCQKNQRPLAWISVADGPGSFTGLRIAVTTAKTLSYALALPLVAVDSLAAIAASVFAGNRDCESLVVATNAYRGQVFHGRFDRALLLPDLAVLADSAKGPLGWTAHPTSVRIDDREAWQAYRAALPPEQPIAGEALPWGDRADSRLERSCDAIGVALLGLRAAASGSWVDPVSLVPRYLKPSAAEEKLQRSQ